MSSEAKSAVGALAQERVVAAAIAAPNPPALTTANSLESLQTLLQFADKFGTDKTRLQKIYNEETKFLDAAIDAINNNELLRMKFGTTFSSALALSGILRNQYEEDLTRGILAKHVPETPSFVKVAGSGKAFVSGSS